MSPSDVSLRREGLDLLLTIAGDTGSLRTVSFFESSTSYFPRAGMPGSILFADGTIWNQDRIFNYARAGAGAGAGDDIIVGTSMVDTIDALAGNDMIYGNGGADVLAGGVGNDEIWGDEGNDRLSGGGGSDTLRGGSGADTYSFAAGWGADIIDDSAGIPEDGSIDAIVFEAGIQATNIQLRFDPTRATDLLILNTATADQIVVQNQFGAEVNSALTDHIEQIRFADGTTWNAAQIFARVTQLVGTEGSDSLGANVPVNLRILGLGGDDNLFSGSGDDELDGGLGGDRMSGGPGQDTYFVDSLNDAVVEFDNAGVDLVRASISWTLETAVENLILLGTAAGGTGNGLANSIIGNSANNMLDGKAGADIMAGGVGNDTYTVDDGADQVIENLNEGTDLVRSSVTFTLVSNVENLTLTNTSATVVVGTGNDLNNVLTGSGGANTLRGLAGNDTLDPGSSGTDVLEGGTGDDLYIINRTSLVGLTLTEFTDEGTDTVQSSIALTLSNNFENLTLTNTGTAVVIGTGNTSNNILTGSAGSNTLVGGAGNDTLDPGSGGTDTLQGQTGDDLYFVNRSNGIMVLEAAGEGTDTVSASITNYTLAANVENLILSGSVAAGTGNMLNNVITGNGAANTLNAGTAGTDTLLGGAGDDIYVVDHAGVTVTELLNEGTDLVQSTVTFTLADNVENLTLTLAGNVNGTGNTGANVLTGNSGNNTLSGGAGNDTLDGGSAGTDSLQGQAGDDTYLVNRSTGIAIVEAAGQGTDLVIASVTHTLATDVENLTMTNTGTAVVVGTGNTGNNILTGSAGSNTLRGLAGDDTLDGGSAGTDVLEGGIGDDTYIVDRALSTSFMLTELANQGTDTIKASVDVVLGTNFENLTFTNTGTTLVTGTGNGGANVLTGSNGNNKFVGGLGADTYRYARGGGSDQIDNVANDSAIDRLVFTDIASGEVRFSRGTGTGNTNNLIATVATGGSVTVLNWFAATANRLDFVTFTNKEVTAAQIDALFAGGGTGGVINAITPSLARLAGDELQRRMTGIEPGDTLARPTLARDARRSRLGALVERDLLDEMNPPRLSTLAEHAAVADAKALIARNKNAPIRWEPIKSYEVTKEDAGVHLVDAAADSATLGEKMASEDAIYRTWQPIKTFPIDATAAGLDRMMIAMTTFGTDRVTLGDVRDSSDLAAGVLEQISARDEAAHANRFREEFQAMLD